MIKYIGSKRVLVPTIRELVRRLPSDLRVLDLFSGTARVGHGLKADGRFVVANDHNTYAWVLGRCYVQADADRIRDAATRLIEELNRVPPEAGYFTQTFCIESRFFQPQNGAKVDAIRNRIAELDLDPDLEAVVLASLMEAADRVDSTTGVQMAYLKKWAPRAFNDLELRVPEILPGPGRATQLDALEAARQSDCEIAYLDPPYNQHSYMGNYHIWETLICWDSPSYYGVACKRVGCKEYKSVFNSKPRAFNALKEVIRTLPSKFIIVSFNDEGYVPREAMEEFLQTIGYLVVIEVDFKRYVGAQIGIYNPSGDKVGRVSHLRNKEYLYVVTQDRETAELLDERFSAEVEQATLF